jgi:hypothetical protein
VKYIIPLIVINGTGPTLYFETGEASYALRIFLLNGTMIPAIAVNMKHVAICGIIAT